MTISTICRKAIKILIITVFWLAVWQALAVYVDAELLLPKPLAVFNSLIKLGTTEKFWVSVGQTLLRVVIGFGSALFFGVILGVATAKISFLRTLLAPVLHIVRAAPVASFIILVLVWIKTDTIPIFISFLMGLPIIWQTVETVITHPDRELLEAAKLFRLKRATSFFYVTLPSALPALLSSAVNCLGFCWKSAVAAEVICQPKYAIGKGLYSAKQHLEQPEVFAYTAVTVILSMFIEILLKWLVKRFSERRSHDAN